MEEEDWKQFEGNPNYWVSNSGKVKSVFNGKERILKQKLDKHGYYTVTIRIGYKQTIPIHRLVAKCFVPNPDNKYNVNHKNFIKTDNRSENLEWITQKESMIRFYQQKN